MFSHTIPTHIDIDASPAAIWAVLTDFAAYGRWNPFVRSIHGELKVGCRLSVVIQPKDAKSMTFSPKILRVKENEELRWLGRVLMPGIFDGEHYFIIQKLPSHTRFIHGEKFRGVLIPLAKARLDGGTKAGFVEMNNALKKFVEEKR